MSDKSIFPEDFFNGSINAKSKEDIPMLYDYLIDISNGHVILDEYGRATIVSGLDAIICQAYRKIFTKQGFFNIYTRTYGSKLYQLLGKGKVFADDFSYQFLSECLVDNKYVTKITNFETNFNGSIYTIDFMMETIYGKTPFHIQDVPITYD